MREEYAGLVGISINIPSLTQKVNISAIGIAFTRSWGTKRAGEVSRSTDNCKLISSPVGRPGLTAGKPALD